MQNAYHRPGSLEEAVALLAAEGSVVLAGGTVLNASRLPEQFELVDLQALGLSEIRAGDGTVRMGSMVRLQDLSESDAVPVVLRDLARREGPNTLRALATIGGTVAAADPESGLLAGLLAFDGVVLLRGPQGETRMAVRELLADPSRLEGSVITHVVVQAGGEAAFESTGRTPADCPIVTAVGRVDGRGTLHLALTGVAGIPLMVGLDELGNLDPPADFRGSVEYRRHLARVLATRAVERLGVTR